MSYIDTHLLSNEKVLYRAKLHWIIFVLPGALAFLALILIAMQLSFFVMMGYLLLAVAGLTWLDAVITYYTTEFGLTSKRVLLKTGFIRRNSLEILLPRIESIQVHQSLIGRMLDYGTIIISGTGGSKDPFSRIAEPLLFRRKVQEQLEKHLM